MSVDTDLVVSPEQLIALLDHTSAVIYMRGLDGRYRFVNREYERIFHLRREDIVGLTDHDLFPADVADEFRANDLAAIAEGRPVRLEEIAPDEDGPHTYITVKFPLIDGDGNPYAICGISTDITERKRAELDAFAYSVSHDLRAPLRSLAGFSEVLQEDYADALDEAGRGYLQRIEVNAARMARMIDDLLDLSRATRVELRRQEVDLTAVAHDVITELHDIDPLREIEVSVADGLTAQGDPHLIRLVLRNLLGNAWKFTARRQPAVVQVAAAGTGGGVFAVRDNGAGFDMRYAAKLFDPFQRLHSSSDFEGTGIGLAIVHRIVQRHGGRIWAEGEPDRGAAFFFTLTTGEATDRVGER
jgi:PAS domain S-box-containing protein